MAARPALCSPGPEGGLSRTAPQRFPSGANGGWSVRASASLRSRRKTEACRQIASEVRAPQGPACKRKLGF